MNKCFYLLMLLALVSFAAEAQQTPSAPMTSFKRGMEVVAPDSIFSINFRFRMQNRAVYNSVSGSDLSASELEARVRRLRLRFEGFMYHPKLTYLIQLSFSRGDMDWSVRHNSPINESPNVVRDAVVFYRPNRNLILIFGQTKLPGNRQRVISSGDQQFIDRSIVNVLYNIDRDFGFQFHYLNNIGRFHYILKGALTGGDGRNVNFTNPGLSYTGRLELLPLGNFTNMGDLFEGDLAREESPKIALAGGYNFNERARRTGGQIGLDLFEERDIHTYIFDALLKYRGFAFYTEFMHRNVNDPVTYNPEGQARHIITGNGKLFQMSYLFKNDFEVAGRFASADPGEDVSLFAFAEDVYTAGVTRYIRNHRLKVQANVSFHNQTGALAEHMRNFWSAGVQMELGI
ncbi:porin [Cytophagaceae bacterium ABcell3]|nr:porin [Cytophagaceae bacterium ABcell3]